MRRIYKTIPLKLLLVLFLCHSAAIAADRWYVSYEKGLEAMNGESWDEAINYFNAAIKDKPESKNNARTYGVHFIDYYPYLYLGIAYFNLGDWKRAQEYFVLEESYGEISESKKSLQELNKYKKLVEERLETGPIPPSTEDLTSIDIRKEQIAQEMKAGIALFDSGKYAEAIDHFKYVLQLSPGHPEATDFLRKAEANRNKTKNSTEKDVKKRVDDEYRKGVRAFNEGDLSEARRKFNNVLVLDPKHRGAKAQLAKLENVSKSEPAPDGAEEVTISVSKDQKVKYGIIAFFEGDFDLAIDLLKNLADTDDNNVNLHVILGCAYSANYLITGEKNDEIYKKAVHEFQKVKSANPNYSLNNKYISPRIVEIFNSR